MTDHPITPPPELVQQWMDDLYHEPGQFVSSDDKALATRAAQWGADQKLEACCAYLVRCAQWEPEDVAELRAALAQPEPKGPTDEELLETATEAVGYEHVSPDETCLLLARAVLARWGRPAIEPVPQQEGL